MADTLGQTPTHCFRRKLWKPGAELAIEHEVTFDDLPLHFEETEDDLDPPTLTPTEFTDAELAARAGVSGKKRANRVGVALLAGTAGLLVLSVGAAIAMAAVATIALSTDIPSIELTSQGP